MRISLGEEQGINSQVGPIDSFVKCLYNENYQTQRIAIIRTWSDLIIKIPPDFPLSLTEESERDNHYNSRKVGISKLIDFILYFHDNAQSSAQKKFPTHRLIV